MKKKRTAKPLASESASKERLAKAAQQIVNIGLAGAILESVAEFLTMGRGGSPLKKVIVDAEARLRERQWRKRIEAIL